MSELTHLDDKGRARMVDVGAKEVSERFALAEAFVFMQPETVALVRSGSIKKGAVLSTAELAGVMASKRTAELIPMCHNVPIDKVEVTCELTPQGVRVRASAKSSAKTGVEMEALVAASTAALTIYDMCKAVEKGMEIGQVRLLEKRGGVRGEYVRG